MKDKNGLLVFVRGCMIICAAALASSGIFPMAPQSLTLKVHVDQPGAKIDPIFYGLMTEEINFSYDGGLYAELIRNRIFQDRPTAVRGPRGAAGNTMF